MSDKNVVLLTDQEHATILNALRFWQAAGRPVYPEMFEGDVVEPVQEEELDGFIERFNTECDLTLMCVIEKGIVTQAFAPDATNRLLIHVFDTDTDTIDEEDLTELPVPMMGIQTGMLYSIHENLAAPDFLKLLDQKILQDLRDTEMKEAIAATKLEEAASESQLSFALDLAEAEGIARAEEKDDETEEEAQ